MLRKPAIVTAVALLALGPAGPAAAKDKDHVQMMADIRQLQDQAQQLQLALAQLAADVKALSGKLDDNASAVRKGLAEQKVLIDPLSGEVRVLREKLDETNLRITTLSQDLQNRVTSAPAPASPGGPSPLQPTLPPQRLYDSAYGDYSVGNYDLAILGFQEFVKNYPNTELTDLAFLMMGQSYFNLRQYKDAITTLDKLTDLFPKSPRAAEAYYKKGLAYQNLGAVDAAAQAFETAVKNFPQSEAAQLARQRLQSLPPKRPL